MSTKEREALKELLIVHREYREIGTNSPTELAKRAKRAWTAAEAALAAREEQPTEHEALEAALDFIQTVEQWKGSDPDEIHELIALIEKTLAVCEEPRNKFGTTFEERMAVHEIAAREEPSGCTPCADCGADYGHLGGWLIEDDLWQSVVGTDPSIVLCPSCFAGRAARGLLAARGKSREMAWAAFCQGAESDEYGDRFALWWASYSWDAVRKNTEQE